MHKVGKCKSELGLLASKISVN